MPDSVANPAAFCRKSVCPVPTNPGKFKQDGALVYYAAYKNHIGFYPTASGIKNFTKELAGFETSKGAIRFPIDEPLPVTLIKKIVKFRVTENKARAALKAKK